MFREGDNIHITGHQGQDTKDRRDFYFDIR